MLSCICFGIGEALVLGLLAGGAGLGAHAATCKPGGGATGEDPTSPTCCNHDHTPAALTPEGRPGSTTEYDSRFKAGFLERQGAPDLSRGLRVAGVFALIALAAFIIAALSGGPVGHEHGGEHNHESEHEHQHEHDHVAHAHN